MEFFDRYRKIFLIAVIIVSLAAIVITVDRQKPTLIETGLGYVLTPIQGFIGNVTDAIGERIRFVSNINEIENENKLLKQQIADTESEVARLKLVEIENEKLTRLLEVDSKYPSHEKIGADIIAKDYGNWYDNFIINKGSAHGLDKNMAVLADGGLVGRITEAGYNYSKVVTLIDDVNAISAKSVRTDDVGFVRGDMTDKEVCRMEYIDTDAEIVRGDEIVTSHLSEIYPPGITLGYVKEVHTDTNTLTKYAIIEPTVDFKHLETVLIITKKFGFDTDTEE